MIMRARSKRKVGRHIALIRRRSTASLPSDKFFVSLVSFVVNFHGLVMKEERKNLEQRIEMTDLERLRHSASHVLATAIFCHSERSRGISQYNV